MGSTAILIVDIIGSKNLASQPGGHTAIHNLCQRMRSFIDIKLKQLNNEGTLDITPQHPQGDDIQYRLHGAHIQKVADISLEAVIAAFTVGPSGKRFRYVVYSLESDINYQPRIKTFGDISKTEKGERHHIAVERSFVSALANSKIIAWLEKAAHVSITLELKGEPWTGVHVDLYCTVGTNEDTNTQERINRGEVLGLNEIEQTDYKGTSEAAATLRDDAQEQQDIIEARNSEALDNANLSSGVPNDGDRVTFAKHVDLSDDDRCLLREILDAAGMDQKGLARAAEVPQSWLSQMLGGRRKRIDGERLERVTNILAEVLNKRKTDHQFSAERVRVTLQAFSRYSSAVADLVPPRVYPPGGLVPVDSSNYVKRKDDDKALDALQQMPFTMIVKGPVQCGKSSLLARLEHNALELGVETAWFDPRLPASQSTQRTKNQLDVNTLAIKQLAELLQAQWGLAPLAEIATDSISQLVNWLLRALTPTKPKPRLLILDDLARLGAQSAEDWLGRFVRAMHNERAIRGLQLSIAVGITHHFGPNFGRRLLIQSSLVNWSPRIELGWFNREEVGELAAKTRRTATADDCFYDLFVGQPYLSHASLVDDSFADAVQCWSNQMSESNAERVRETQTYKRHLSVIRFAIMGPLLEAVGETRRLVQTFADVCNGREPRYEDDKLFFDTLKLISDTGEPTLAIYRLIADDLVTSMRK